MESHLCRDKAGSELANCEYMRYDGERAMLNDW